MTQASAAKRGRNPRFPYVPVIIEGNRTAQVRGYAFATRDEAIAFAHQQIARTAAHYQAQMARYAARHAPRVSRADQVARDEAEIDEWLMRDAFERGICI